MEKHLEIAMDAYLAKRRDRMALDDEVDTMPDDARPIHNYHVGMAKQHHSQGTPEHKSAAKLYMHAAHAYKNMYGYPSEVNQALQRSARANKASEKLGTKVKAQTLGGHGPVDFRRKEAK
jgi:hypothetical protein